MGNRNCAVEGCNALEFRTTGVCNKHQGMSAEVPEATFFIHAGQKTEKEKTLSPEQQTSTHEQFECPRGCGTMTYEETQVGFTDLSMAISLGIMVLAGIYLIGSFLVYDWSNTALATNGYPPHPHIVVVVLFGVAFIVNSSYGIINSKTHHCDSCRGTMLEEKEMAYIFDEPSLVKLNSLIDSMAPSSSDLQCPICDEKMGTFSVPYIPADDETNLRINRVGSYDADKIVVGWALNLVVAGVKAAIPNAEETMDLDSCVDCRVIWFDGSEKNKLGDGTIN
ncbi:MAG: hypothetical protein CND01_04580 [Marine Group II euryarchaeote MED-G34]|nr:MAG: hypothetical protein CND01_04580 [Marine Group II euryarchaeote MED-G34]